MPRATRSSMRGVRSFFARRVGHYTMVPIFEVVRSYQLSSIHLVGAGTAGNPDNNLSQDFSHVSDIILAFSEVRHDCNIFCRFPCQQVSNSQNGGKCLPREIFANLNLTSFETPLDTRFRYALTTRFQPCSPVSSNKDLRREMVLSLVLSIEISKLRASQSKSKVLPTVICDMILVDILLRYFENRLSRVV